MKKEDDNSFGIASVSIGAVSLALSFSNQPIAIILGIVAMILSKKQHKNDWSRWGRNLGLASIIISVILIIVVIVVISKNPDLLNQLAQLQK